MADNTFDSEELDIQFQPITAYIDGDGSFKLNTPMLSSLDFDGSIPKVEDEALSVVDVMPGFFIKLEEDGDYFVVESVEVDEEFIDSTGLVTINYIDDQGQIVSVDYDDTDTVHVMYEDWDEKILGSRGWGITSGGNAIFTNVAVRGRIEAEEGYISGTLTIGDGGSNSLGDALFSGDAADDINTNVTTINGGKITTGSITADKINTNNLFVQNLETTTNTGSQRIKVSSDLTNYIQFKTGNTNESNYGYINTINNTTDLQLNFVSPQYSSESVAQINLMSQSSGGSLITINGTNIYSLGNFFVSSGNYYYGDGSQLTGVGSPIVVSTSGPSSPASYADNTVWYVV